MNAHEHGSRVCAAGDLIERVNATIEAVGVAMIPGSSTQLPFEIAVQPLVIHTNLTAEEADCLINNAVEGALSVMIARGGCDAAVLRGLVGQAFMAGVFAGKDAA